jgi:hypothetical protein
MDRRNIAYWVTTTIFCLVLGFSGVMHSIHAEFMVESMAAMGYPVYFMSIIGMFKLLGVAALLAPRWPLLKEWAYAGFTFNLIGAAGSHLFSGEPITDWIRPLVVLGIGAASYHLRADPRRLPETIALAARTRRQTDASTAASPLAQP